jgi:pyruvate ferredoxin oxidoreductase beta subunit
MNKVKKGMDVKGPAYIQILSPCPTGWRCATDNAVDIGRQAVQCGMFPLFEIDKGNYKISYNPENLKPVADYLKAQGRFRHLSDIEIKKIQDKVDHDWARLKTLASLGRTN